MALSPLVRFRFLGPLEFFDGQRWSSIGAAKQRALLAVLLINANRAVAADQLVAELWGERPPASAAGLLAGYVWRLRGALNDHSGQILATRAPGYQLTVPPGAADLHDYETLVATGRRELAAGDLAAGVDSLAAALNLWRGAPLADVALVPSVLAESARLEEARLAVVEARIEAEVALGRHEFLLAELKQLVSQFPLRERLHAHLMVALYRTGQQAEALGAYRDLRRLLIDELGIEPSKPLRELQGRILREDPTLHAVQHTAPVTTAPRLPVAGTLPPDVPVFVGREQELARLTGRLADGEQRCAIHGMAGVGKTALAVHAAYQVADRFPDGQVYLDLDSTAPSTASHRLLAALAVPAEDIPSDDERAAALLRGALADRRIVVVLDNVVDTGQIHGLLPTTPGCATIIVGRPATAAVAGSGLLHLSRLPAPAAVRLIRQYAGARRMAADPDATARIARLCDHLPLALRIAATRLAHNPEWTVRDLATRLADPTRRLDTLSGNGSSVANSLVAGVDLLRRGGDPAATRTLRLLGVLDLPVVHTAVLAAALAVPHRLAELAAARLVDAGLIETATMDRYRVPELVRLFARGECGTAVGERAATRRVLGYYESAVRGHIAGLDTPRGRQVELAWYRQECATLRALAATAQPTTLPLLVSELRTALWRREQPQHQR